MEWKYVASELLRHFRLEGPNGRHLVLVLPVYGPRISHVEMDDKNTENCGAKDSPPSYGGVSSFGRDSSWR